MTSLSNTVVVLLLGSVAVQAQTSISYNICEDENVYLNCSSGQYVQILAMSFDRTDNATCPTPLNRTDLDNMQCPTPAGSLQKLQTYCTGRQGCYFVAEYQVWGYNPDVWGCGGYGVRRQASVEFVCRDCVDAAANCETLAAQGLCDTDYDNMMNTCYKTCSKCGQKDCGNAYGGGTTSPHACDSWAMNLREECTYSPGNMLSNCNESCLCNTLVREKTLEACEGESRQVVCNTTSGGKEYIQITDMFYGRKDNNSCGSPYGDIQCSTPSGSLDKLRTYCNGRKSCWFMAEDGIWGFNSSEANCAGIHNQGSVSYMCKECKDRGYTPDCENWAAQGQCITDYDNMMEQCFKTCTKCGQKDCGNVDDDKQCDGFAMNQRGECTYEQAAQYMMYACNESCLCNTAEPSITTQPATAPVTNQPITESVTTTAGSSPFVTTANLTDQVSNLNGGSAATQFQVRLSQGHVGRVEVIYNGELGTVCDDQWTDENCKVVCSQLSMSGGKSYCCAQFGEGSGRILLDHVTCDGTEQSLFDCGHNPWGYSNCDHSEDAGCECNLAGVQIIP